MAFDVKKAAAVGAAAAGVLVLSSGWLMSLCSYSDTVEKARQGIELYLLNGNPELKDQGLSVALYERDGSLFERKLNLVVTLNEDSFNLPLDVSLNYGSYDIVFDPIHATISRVNAIKSLELDTLTDIKARAHLSLFTGKLSFDGSVSYLNDTYGLSNYAYAKAFDDYQTLLKGGKFVKDTSKKVKANAPAEPAYVYDAHKSKEENLVAFEEFKKQAIKDANNVAEKTVSIMGEESLEQVKADTRFLPVGTAKLSIKMDANENISTSLVVDSFVSDDLGLGLSGVKYYSSNRGLANLLNFGRNEVQCDKIFYPVGNHLELLDNTVVKLQSGHVATTGAFDLAYELKIAKASDFSDLNLNGKLSGLTINMFNNMSVGDILATIGQNGLDLRVSKGSTVKVPALVRFDPYKDPEMRDVTLGIDGNVTLPKDSPMGIFTVPFVDANVTADLDVNTIEGSSINKENLAAFSVHPKTGVSSAKVILDENGLTINGKEFVE